MQQPQSPTPTSLREAQTAAQRLVHTMIGLGRFTKHDALFDLRAGRFRVGLWRLDHKAAEYARNVWPIRRATIHWRRHDIVVNNALNFEFQIDREVPFAILSGTVFEANSATFVFGNAMRIVVGIRELSVTCEPTDAIRTDWGVKAWTIALASDSPVLTVRGV